MASQTVRVSAQVVKASASCTTGSATVARAVPTQSKFMAGARLAQSASAARSGRTALSVVARDAAWAPGSEAPEWLDGSMAGDFGFDPLGLAKDPDNLVWYRQAEIVHARFAMLGVAGCVFPDIAAKAGISWAGAGVDWYDAATFDYFAPTAAIWTTQVIMMGYAETRRWLDIKNPGSVNQDPVFSSNSLPEGVVGYPGGIFDPFGWASKDMSSLQLKEIKNGRLAMIAMMGIYTQHAVVGGTPVENWAAHVASPWDTTILTNMSDLFVWDWVSPSSTISTVAPFS
ncbi:hypothetical protein CYMTET_3810 [Cymbomonas tetramitiformis]|uniref:Chlorophyll a-b binding protein, chloroplastic n=1 Tax=Cymbomonas tetramitiformis TaxID=36881 RepID=A0AAE0LEG4_9CHLO|nr:hypothetical protein CYMTET_10440 [Cymbomonas tetramitiformis]KAK3288723.1 hypothetical protein CYMTET_3810 [Cymbomonas tetramitiformis]|eukprot:gene22844-27610_t